MDENLIYEMEGQTSFDLTSILIKTGICFFLIWIAKFFWSWRNLVRLSSKIQGPSGYPILGNALEFLGKTADDIFDKLIDNFKIYPGIFRIWLGQRLVIAISKPEYMEIILNHPACLEKDGMYDFTKVYMGNGLFSAPVSIWKKNRKLINPSFNRNILDSFIDVFNQQSKELLEVLEKTAGETFDIFPLISAYNVDNICATVMGVKRDIPSKFSDFGEHLDLGMKMILVRGTNIWYHNDFIFSWTNIKKTIDQANQTINKFTKKVVSDKKEWFDRRADKIKRGEEIADPPKWTPLLEYMLQLSKENKDFTSQQIQDEVNTFMAAGTDTSAGTLAFFFVVLGTYPEIQKRIYDEVIEVVGEDREVTTDDLAKLEYMERAIKESMRLFTTTPMFLRTPSEDVDLDGTKLPAGCSLLLFSLDTHRNPRYWKDPLKFDPDRFLPEEVAKRHPYSFIPFSGGPRGCIGFKYAMMSMKSLIAILVRRIVFKSQFKSIVDIDLTFNPLLKPRNGFNITLQIRK